jgi:hypothetical protein
MCRDAVDTAQLGLGQCPMAVPRLSTDELKRLLDDRALSDHEETVR